VEDGYKRLYEIVSRGVEEELNYAKKLRRLAENIKHPVLRALFEAIAHDSEKHSLILAAIKSYLENNRPLLSSEDLEAIKKEIGDHIREESEAIKELTEILEHVKEPQLRLLLEAMLADERAHHELLINIEKVIVEKETVSEDDFWDYIWRHSPWHGAPGG
jgi:rubrerythrin